MLLNLSLVSSVCDVVYIWIQLFCLLLQGSFAEVRVYSLGVFAVVSCLKRESYTVPPKGLSLKLPMDPRVCLSYLPGSFAAPVMAQTMVRALQCDCLTVRASLSFQGFRILAKKNVVKETCGSKDLDVSQVFAVGSEAAAAAFKYQSVT